MRIKPIREREKIMSLRRIADPVGCGAELSRQRRERFAE